MILPELKQFKAEDLTDIQNEFIRRLAIKARKDVIRMINQAGSGHLGGALSSIDICVMLWLCANVRADNTNCPSRDRIVISHGHTSAAVYAVLGNLGYFNLSDAIASFRKGGIFEGHPCIKVPGIEWCSGSLGQGLSVGCGFALAAKMKKKDFHVFVVMGDGEQAKGQLSEAREFASKYCLNNLTAIIDCNGLQASGRLEEIMPQNIMNKYKAAGWKAIEIDGHNYNEIYKALRQCYHEKEVPTVVFAKTVMGKGISFIENNYEYHGKVLSQKQYEQALSELCYTEKMHQALYIHLETSLKNNERLSENVKLSNLNIKYGTPIIYEKGKMVDCRSAFGEALCDIAVTNTISDGAYIAAIDCDLAESVKLQKFKSMFPEKFVECGIQEHNAATIAGALSKSGIITFLASFGVFGIDEIYGQLRMNDLNETSIKLICTHNGLDVGEDGKTHQCIDYISVMSNLLGFKIIIPADANQTDRAVRYAAITPGNIVIMMGRSKLPVLTDEHGNVLFDENYRFEYGKADWVREGTNGTIITCGTMVCRALNAHQKLKQKGINVGVLNLSCPVELDYEKVIKAAKTGLIVTYEDHNIRTGIGSIIGTFLSEKGFKCRFKRIGITHYGASASPDYQYKIQHLDEDSLVELIEKLIIEA